MGNQWTISQQAAMELHGKSLLVSAAAGSGKTSVLTERIIRCLTDENSPADISRLLVVTFTRAAAAELKAKIAKALTNALAKDPSNKRLANQLLLLGSADISTIDSFFQRIVRENFEQLEISANFRIADDHELLPLCFDTMEGVMELFYDLYKPKPKNERACEVVRNNAFTEMMDHLMSNRSDGKSIPLLLRYYDKFSSYPEGIERLQQCASSMHAQADQDFFLSDHGEAIAERLLSYFQDFQNELHEIKDSLAYDPAILQKCEPLLDSDITFCKTICHALSQKCYLAAQSALNGFVSSARFPTIKNKPQEAEFYKNWRTVFKNEIKEAQALLSVPPAVISEQMHKTADFASMLYRFFAEYRARIDAEKKVRGVLEHNDVRSLLYRLLTDPSGNTSEFARSLSSRYDAVYIDEYQDVDFLQDRIFEIIGGRKSFMVGDIKQSIYGFRGSEPSIFAAYRRQMPLYTDPAAAKADGNCVFMSDNFRCNRSVIDFANHVCAFLFSACEKSVGYRPQDDLVCSKAPQNEENAASVQVAVFDRTARSEDTSETDLTDEAVWTGLEIQRILKEEKLDNGKAVTPSDISILVRNKAHGTLFAEVLKNLSIPVSSETSVNLLFDPLLIDLLNYLRLIDNPYRDIPLSEFLLSPFGRFSLEELSRIRASAPEQKSLFDAMRESFDNSTFDVLLQEKIKRFLEKVDFYAKSSEILPADKFLRLLYLDAIFVNRSTEPAFLYLYDQARLYQRTSWCGLYGFLKHIDSMIENGKNNGAGFQKAEDAVTIMTVHHSKGLEFPVVFLCSCGSPFNRTDTTETFVFHNKIGCATKLYNPLVAGSETTVLREAIAAQIDEDMTEESIRTLYVALTRARERLYVTGTLNGQWENALSAAKLIKRGNRRSILGCNNFLSWILASLFEKGNMPGSCNVAHYTHDQLLESYGMLSENDSKKEADMDQKNRNASNDPSVMRYVDICRTNEAFHYPLEALNAIPSKIAASKITGDLLDQLEADNALERTIELMQNAEQSFSSVLSSEKNVSATVIGTATHEFLQFCNFEKLRTEGIDCEMKRLIEEHFMDVETISLIHRKQLEDFLTSQPFEMALHAKKVYREQKFGMELPLSSLTVDPQKKQAFAGHSIFVQGSIDLLLEMEDGRLFLFDYKTDRISSELLASPHALIEKMTIAHGHQLSCYAEAVRQMFGRKPDQSYVYSLPLGRAIEIETVDF